MRDTSHHNDSTSQQSGSTISLTSHIDTATSIRQSDRITGMHFQQHNQKIKHPAVGLIDDRSTVETRKASSEQPSPVSVLDSTFYRDDSPSPVKKISNAFKSIVLVQLIPYMWYRMQDSFILNFLKFLAADGEAQILDIAGNMLLLRCSISLEFGLKQLSIVICIGSAAILLSLQKFAASVDGC